MSLQNDPSFTIEEAAKRGQDVFEVLFSNWGVGSPTATLQANSSYPGADLKDPAHPVMTPAINISLAAIALGPRATVDRAWVSYDLQKSPTTPSTNARSRIGLTPRTRVVTHEAPLLYTQAAQRGVAQMTTVSGSPLLPDALKAQAEQGLLYVFAAAGVNAVGLYALDTTVIPLTYLNISNTPISFADNARCLPPFLHLLLYLKPPIASPPIARFPLLRTTTVVSVGATEEVLALVPIYGRKHVRASVRSVGALSSMRTALIRNVNQVATTVWETDSKTVAVLANGVGELQYDHPCADYLAVYGTAAAGGNSTLVQVAAYD